MSLVCRRLLLLLPKTGDDDVSDDVSDGKNCQSSVLSFRDKFVVSVSPRTLQLETSLPRLTEKTSVCRQQ